MKVAFSEIIDYGKRFARHLNKDHVSAYATASAYFIILSFLPFLLLLMTSVKYTPLTKNMVIDVLCSITPEGFHFLLKAIINEIYSISLAVVPVSAIIALWSAGKGMQSITKGLNVIYQVEETRFYIILRLRAIFYTLILLLVIIVTLVLMVFGNRIQHHLAIYFPFISKLTSMLLNLRVIIVTVCLSIVFVGMYHLLPNHHIPLRYHIPGAILASVSWSLCSFAFSIYIDYVETRNTMYGSLTTIVLVLLWMYFCMYLILIGAEVNMFFKEHGE